MHSFVSCFVQRQIMSVFYPLKCSSRRWVQRSREVLFVVLPQLMECVPSWSDVQPGPPVRVRALV